MYNKRYSRYFIIIPILFIILWICTPSITLHSSVSDDQASSNHKSEIYDSRWDHFAIALKTGKDVALEKTPLQLMTFLSTVRNKIIIGEAPNVTIGEYEMKDVYTHLYDHDASILAKRGVVQSESVPNEDSIGWKSDAHKNLPGFKLLYQTFPHADWYIMIDDDTYLIKRNLDHLLKRYNPSLPFYFGASNMFLGCDNVTEWGKGPFFAHGGSGIVMSKAALKLMLNIVDTCILKYRDCWAGDVRTALCLRDTGILLKDIPGFNKDPPNDKFAFGGDPCLKPITFHHLLLHQIQSLAKMENDKASQAFITMADVFKMSRNGLPNIMPGTDRRGWDITSVESSDIEDCEKKCEAMTECVSFVHSESRCWLKKGIPGSEQKNGFISGVIPSKFVCTNII